MFIIVIYPLIVPHCLRPPIGYDTCARAPPGFGLRSGPCPMSERAAGVGRRTRVGPPGPRINDPR